MVNKLFEQYGDIWEDPVSGHKIGYFDCNDKKLLHEFISGNKSILAIQDPPYNIGINKEFSMMPIEKYIAWTKSYIENTLNYLDSNASLYLWTGADIKNHFQPFPEVIQCIKENFKNLKSRNLITLRNQRGYGTLKNWMSVRQELLYYTIGNPVFNVSAEYTDIPKKTDGFYKEVDGKKISNMNRSRSKTIRAGNVWFDIQQVFFLSKENVDECYAQKPIKAIQRIISASSNIGDLVLDFFCHSGTTLLASEILNRKCFTIDINPEYCNLAYMRLINYRENKKLGFGRKKNNIMQVSS